MRFNSGFKGLNTRLGGFLSSESRGEGNNPTRSENRIPGMQ